MFFAGSAKTIITPPVGIELAGYSFGRSVGILDDLEAAALVLSDDEREFVMITVDILTVGEPFVANVRKRIEQAIGIRRDAVLVSASHSHSSPTAHSLRQWGPVDEDYLRVLESALVGVAKMAKDRLQPARLGYARGWAENLSQNRRGIQDLRDLAVPVLRVDSENGEPLAVLFNFSCHPVCLHSYRNLISADYPGYTRRVIRKIFGDETVAMFTLGAAGDINPAGFRFKETHPVHARKIGEILGCEVAKVALDAVYSGSPLVKWANEKVALPVVPFPSTTELEQMVTQYSEEADCLRAENCSWEEISVAEIKRDWAKDALKLVEAGKVKSAVSAEIQVCRLGDVAILAAPFELFTATSLAIKEASPAQLTLIGANSNGGVGYLPTQDAYEVEDYTNPQGLAPKIYGVYALAPQAEPIFRQNAIQLIQKLFA